MCELEFRGLVPDRPPSPPPLIPYSGYRLELKVNSEMDLIGDMVTSVSMRLKEELDELCVLLVAFNAECDLLSVLSPDYTSPCSGFHRKSCNHVSINLDEVPHNVKTMYVVVTSSRQEWDSYLRNVVLQLSMHFCDGGRDPCNITPNGGFRANFTSCALLRFCRTEHDVPAKRWRGSILSEVSCGEGLTDLFVWIYRVEMKRRHLKPERPPTPLPEDIRCTHLLHCKALEAWACGRGRRCDGHTTWESALHLRARLRIAHEESRSDARQPDEKRARLNPNLLIPANAPLLSTQWICPNDKHINTVSTTLCSKCGEMRLSYGYDKATDVVCKYFLTGHCQSGIECKFMHGLGKSDEYFQQSEESNSMEWKYKTQRRPRKRPRHSRPESWARKPTWSPAAPTTYRDKSSDFFDPPPIDRRPRRRRRRRRRPRPRNAVPSLPAHRAAPASPRRRVYDTHDPPTLRSAAAGNKRKLSERDTFVRSNIRLERDPKEQVGKERYYSPPAAPAADVPPAQANSPSSPAESNYPSSPTTKSSTPSSPEYSRSQTSPVPASSLTLSVAPLDPPAEHSSPETIRLLPSPASARNKRETWADCPICFQEIQTTPMSLDSCVHVFHGGCIKEWLFDQASRCPVCREEVTKVYNLQESIIVPHKTRDNDEEEDAEYIPVPVNDGVDVCMRCQKGDNEALLMQCGFEGHSCLNGIHTYCHDPPMETVSHADVPWWCPSCVGLWCNNNCLTPLQPRWSICTETEDCIKKDPEDIHVPLSQRMRPSFFAMCENKEREVSFPSVIPHQSSEILTNEEKKKRRKEEKKEKKEKKKKKTKQKKEKKEKKEKKTTKKKTKMSTTKVKAKAVKTVPVKKRHRKILESSSEGSECLCGRAPTGKSVEVQCDGCQRWYHQLCVGYVRGDFRCPPCGGPDVVIPTEVYDLTDESEEVFEFENVRAKGFINGQLHYLVKWKGYHETFNSWEPSHHVPAGSYLNDVPLVPP